MKYAMKNIFKTIQRKMSYFKFHNTANFTKNIDVKSYNFLSAVCEKPNAADHGKNQINLYKLYKFVQ